MNIAQQGCTMNVLIKIVIARSIFQASADAVLDERTLPAEA